MTKGDNITAITGFVDVWNVVRMRPLQHLTGFRGLSPLLQATVPLASSSDLHETNLKVTSSLWTRSICFWDSVRRNAHGGDCMNSSAASSIVR